MLGHSKTSCSTTPTAQAKVISVLVSRIADLWFHCCRWIEFDRAGWIALQAHRQPCGQAQEGEAITIIKIAPTNYLLRLANLVNRATLFARRQHRPCLSLATPAATLIRFPSFRVVVKCADALRAACVTNRARLSSRLSCHTPASVWPTCLWASSLVKRHIPKPRGFVRALPETMASTTGENAKPTTTQKRQQ